MKPIKRVGICILCIVWAFTIPAQAKAVFFEEESGETAAELMAWNSIPAEESVQTATGTALTVGGKSAILIDFTSGKVLFQKNEHEKLPIASVTKIMTLLLVMEALDNGMISLTDSVTCSAEAASMGGSQIWLEPGEVMSVHDLVKAAAVVSANDACAALAEHVAGSVEEFVARMNTRAAELGMNDTHFLDCSGLNDEAYSCAYDVAVMSRELMKHPTIKQYTTIWMDTLRDGQSQLVNTNKLVRFYEGITGLKTGTTATAGHNLAATAERNGLALGAVMLGCTTTAERFGGARKLLDYGFANYTLYTPQVDPLSLKPITVLHGVEESVEIAAQTPAALLVKKGEEKQMSCIIELAEDVAAPVEKGQVVGTVTVKKGEETVATYSVSTKNEVKRLHFGIAFSRLLRTLCR